MNFLQSYRVCVYVPQDHLERFVEAVSPHIPSFLGNYDHVCWWSEKGIEQFRKLPAGKIERVECHRFECSLPYNDEVLQSFITNHIRPNHPWEEPVVTITTQKIANFS